MFDEALPSKDKKLKVGFVREMEYFPVSPAVRRAMDISKQALEDAGYEVVDFHLTEEDHKRANDHLMGVIANTSIKYFDLDF